MAVGKPIPFAPSAEDWEQIEQIGDLLSGEGQNENLEDGLARVLAALRRESAALFILSRHGSDHDYWLRVNLPFHWDNQLDDRYSRLHTIARQVVELGDSLPEPPPDLAGAFAVRVGSHVAGALLVHGEPIPPEDYPRWEAYLRPIGRAIEARRGERARVGIHTEIAALQLIAAAQSGDFDINTLQRRVLQSLRDIFAAEDALLILLDEENPQMAIKKQLGMGEDWIERTSLDLENSLVYRSIKDGRCVEADLCSSEQFAPWLSSTTGISIEKILCAPLIANHCSIGAVVLVNSEVDQNDLFRQSLLNLLCTNLANAISTNRQLLNLKISIADLEASRWEIVNSRNTLRTLFDSIPSSVYIIDRNYILISINIRRSNRAGRRPSMLVGKKCYEQLYNRSDPCPACRVMETFTSAAITSRFSREWLDPDKFIEWEITTFPIQEKTNLPHQVIIFEEDVTEKRNLEANLIQSEKLAAVGQLAAGVAHEINNPLAAIIANAQILLREMRGGDPDTVDAIRLIETAGIRASQVVSNLLSIARKEKKYEFELLSLNETITSALSLVHHEVVNHSIEIITDFQEEMPEIVASKNQIQGVWINLIVNSIDAIDKEHGRITISSRYADHEFRVVITDNGKGIPEDQLTRIFEPFFTTKVAGKGTGLGLSVCLRVIKEHQGSIQVESQTGKGSRFTIILPDLARSSTSRAI